MQGPFTQPYLTLGDLIVDFGPQGEVREYERDLDLERAIASVRYRAGDVNFEREAFCSYPDRVLVMRLACDRPGALTFTARLSSPLRSSSPVLEADASTGAQGQRRRNTSIRLDTRARILFVTIRPRARG